MLTNADLIGRKVETLFDEDRAAGIYESKWDGSKSGSGVYCCRLEAGGITQIKKLILLK